VFGGELFTESAVERRLEVSGVGEFNLEFDWDYLKKRAAQEGEPEDGRDWMVDTLKSAAALVVPVEVVCPPLPLSRLELLDPMVDALREGGAAGTGDSLLAAFGVHINAEAPALDAATVSRFVKAFALLQWWLVQTHEVDLSRKITPFVDLYPQAYLLKLFSTDYADTDEFADDYLEHNPSRNRALDMLPLLSHLDEERVRAVVDDPRIKSRPAFHYRLPNCHIERPGWSLAEPWNVWVVVERLASRPDDIDALAREYLDSSRPIVGVGRTAWVEHVNRWLTDRGLA
jgi:hypothetical protein